MSASIAGADVVAFSAHGSNSPYLTYEQNYEDDDDV